MHKMNWGKYKKMPLSTKKSYIFFSLKKQRENQEGLGEIECSNSTVKHA